MENAKINTIKPDLSKISTPLLFFHIFEISMKYVCIQQLNLCSFKI